MGLITYGCDAVIDLEGHANAAKAIHLEHVLLTKDDLRTYTEHPP